MPKKVQKFKAKCRLLAHVEPDSTKETEPLFSQLDEAIRPLTTSLQQLPSAEDLIGHGGKASPKSLPVFSPSE